MNERNEPPDESTPPPGDRTPPPGDRTPPPGDRTPPPGDRTPPTTAERTKPPTIWIAATVIFALAAVALAIWGFTTKSDLDDANATIAEQQAQLKSQQQQASTVEEQQATVAAEIARRYKSLRTRFNREEKEAAELKADVDKESQELTQARQATANATSADERADAQLNESRQEKNVAAACARGALDSINSFFDAEDVDSGAEEAVKRLQDLEERCQEAVSAS